MTLFCMHCLGALDMIIFLYVNRTYSLYDAETKFFVCEFWVNKLLF